MGTLFKVWIEIEAYDASADYFETIDGSAVGEFVTEKEARDFACKLGAPAPQLERNKA